MPRPSGPRWERASVMDSSVARSGADPDPRPSAPTKPHIALSDFRLDRRLGPRRRAERVVDRAVAPDRLVEGESLDRDRTAIPPGFGRHSISFEQGKGLPGERGEVSFGESRKKEAA